MPASPALNRNRPLDWLRGLMAFSIMVYHLHDLGEDQAGFFLGRLGIYGVSIFFVLSGLSMAIAYDRFILDLRSSVAFFVRRIFRIWPLLWLAVALVAFAMWRGGKPLSAGTLALNLTTLFGFVAPTRYVNNGAWSIGNEMVYYALTPALIVLYRWRKWMGWCVTAASFAVAGLFAFHWLNPHMRIEDQWGTYINPFDNLYFYCSGLMLYYGLRETKPGKTFAIAAPLCVVAAFVFLPVTGNQINIASGGYRVVFSLLSILLVYAFWKMPDALPKAIGDRLEQLGMATYGVYLLHPIVQGWSASLLHRAGIEWPWVLDALVIGITIPGAFFIYRVYEFPMIQLGKRLAPGRKVGAANASRPLATAAGGQKS